MFKPKLVLDKYTGDHGSYAVIEMTYNGRPARLLFGEDSSPQSGLALDDDPELLFNYNQRFLEIVVSCNPSSVLVIGGGAFTLPLAIRQRLKCCAVDVVEIDPLLPDVARQHFGLGPDRLLNVFVEDGRDFLARSNKKYDIVIVDAFSGMEIPRQLLSLEAAGAYKGALEPNGLVAINFISAYHVRRPDLAHELIKTFTSVFSSVEIYPADHTQPVTTSENLVLVASDDTPSLDYLQSSNLPALPDLAADIIRDN